MTAILVTTQTIPAGYGGNTQIKGTITKLGVDVSRRWFCIDRVSMKPIAVGKSDDSGAYTIRYLRYLPNRYLVVAVDDAAISNPLNAAVADLITPEPMP